MIISSGFAALPMRKAANSILGVDDSENIVGVKNARKLLEDMFHKVVPFHKTILRFIKVMTEMLYPCTNCAFNYLMIQKHRRVK